MNTRLSVNVNKVALVRNTRHLGIPSVTRAALLCLQAGAHGITIHPRPDGRHIRAHDVGELAALLHQWPGREFNIEGNPLQNLMPHIEAARPQQATFVPDAEDQFTSDHGFDLTDAATRERLAPLIAQCRAWGVRVSLFMDPLPQQMPLARAPAAWSCTPSLTPWLLPAMPDKARLKPRKRCKPKPPAMPLPPRPRKPKGCK